MRFFGWAKKAELQITSDDREWVLNNFLWLVKTFGFPQNDQRLVSEQYFSITLKHPDFIVENLVADFCIQLNLDKDQFHIEFFEDIRDTSNIPYELEESPSDCRIEFDEKSGKYTLILARSILRHPTWLISLFCYEFTRAKLIASKSKFESDSDTALFLYLAAVYFGYGVVIGDNSTHVGTSMHAMWETRWAYATNFPYPVMAYSLAIFAHLRNDPNPFWKEVLPKEMRIEFELALEHIRSSTSELFDIQKLQNEVKAEEFYQLGDRLFRKGQLEEALSTFQKTLDLTEDAIMKSDVFNYIGYLKIETDDYQGCLSDFRMALKYNPQSGYASDNLGFALIMTGETDKGRDYLNKAIQTKNNDLAYTYRNLALYYQKKGNYLSAETHFQKAFERQSPVDFLEYFYGCFLLEKGDDKKGLEYIRKSADKGEIKGIEMMKKMN